VELLRLDPMDDNRSSALAETIASSSKPQAVILVRLLRWAFFMRTF
jgi:hypothetical protein